MVRDHYDLDYRFDHIRFGTFAADVNIWKAKDQDEQLKVFGGLTFTFLCVFYPLVYVVLGIYSFTLPLWQIDRTISHGAADQNRTFTHLISSNNTCMLVSTLAIVAAIVCKFALPASNGVDIVMQNAAFDLLTHVALFGELLYEYASQIAQAQLRSTASSQAGTAKGTMPKDMTAVGSGSKVSKSGEGDRGTA
ncbi:hypothetical protein HDV00_001885 [Rhizophlyctis rosea]|nr:hypothetical protein HDV00_001885 [Rhizophlyctis rosea]